MTATGLGPLGLGVAHLGAPPHLSRGGVAARAGGATRCLQFVARFRCRAQARFHGQIRTHWLDVICNGNLEHFTYLERWAAHKIQNLCDPAGVCLVMRSGEGAGKGLAMKPLMRIYGSHALQITQAKHLTGHFNAHLLDTVFLFVDEGYWAGDKAAEGVLKGLVTEEVMTIEPQVARSSPIVVTCMPDGPRF